MRRFVRSFIGLSFMIIVCAAIVLFFADAAAVRLRTSVFIDETTANGPSLSDNDFYGIDADGIGDIDDDGVEDMAACAYQSDLGGTDRGVLYIHFMQSDGSVRETVTIGSGTPNGPTLIDGDSYCSSVTGLGDLDGDGVEDIAVGALGDDTGGSGRGAVYIHFLDTDGSVLSTTKFVSGTTNGATLVNGDNYGSAVERIDDLDGDLVPELMVGAIFDDTGGSNRGAAYLHFLQADGSIKSTKKFASGTNGVPALVNNDRYGISVANLGDLNNDGVADVAVGAFFDDTGGSNRGAVYVHFLDVDGSVVSTTKLADTTNGGPSLIDGAVYGYRVAGLGDVDGDGAEDVLVGAPGQNGGGSLEGQAFIHFLRTDGTIARTEPIDSSITNGPELADGDGFGTATGVFDDLDGRGLPDIIVGANLSDGGGSDRGKVWISFLNRSTGGVKIEQVIPKNIAIVLQEGASCTTDSLLRAHITADDAVQIRYSLDSSFPKALWQDFPSDGLDVELPIEPRQGIHTLYVEFVSRTNHLSGVAYASIEYDAIGFCGNPPVEDDSSLDAMEEVFLPAGILPHDVLRLASDGDRRTMGDTYIFYIGSDGNRYVFPDESTYLSWYCSFTSVREVSPEILSLIPLKKRLRLRPGTGPVAFLPETRPQVIGLHGEAVSLSQMNVRELYGERWQANLLYLSPAWQGDYVRGSVAEVHEQDIELWRNAYRNPGDALQIEGSLEGGFISYDCQKTNELQEPISSLTP